MSRKGCRDGAASAAGRRQALAVVAALGVLTPALANAQGFDPTSVGDLALWLDASDASTLTTDGSSRLTWADKSADANDVTAPLAANSPVPASFGARPVLRFDGSDDHLCGLQSIDVSMGHTTFVVARNRVRKQVNGWFSLRRQIAAGVPAFDAADLEIYWELGTTDAGSGHLTYAGNRGGDASLGTFQALDAPPPVGDLTVVEVVVGPGNATLSTDGVPRASSAGPNLIPEEIVEPCVGYGFGSAVSPATILDGDIAEVLVYRSLTPLDAQAVEDYLLAKWSGTCGNGVLDSAFEVCDDGNLSDGDACSASCDVATPVARRIPFRGVYSGPSIPIIGLFRFYDAETGGSIIWGPETHLLVPEPDLQFSVSIGSISPPIDFRNEAGASSPDGIPDLDQLDGQQLFLEVELIDLALANTLLTPRRRVLPHPHASSTRIAEVAQRADPGSLGNDHFVDGGLSANDFVSEAGVEFAEVLGTTAVPTGPPVVIATITLDAPTGGFAVVKAVATVPKAVNALVTCAITSNTAALEGPVSVAEPPTLLQRPAPVALTRGLTLARGATDLHLLCESPLGSAVENASLTAIFTPTGTAPQP